LATYTMFSSSYCSTKLIFLSIRHNSSFSSHADQLNKFKSKFKSKSKFKLNPNLYYINYKIKNKMLTSAQPLADVSRTLPTPAEAAGNGGAEVASGDDAEATRRRGGGWRGEGVSAEVA
jgi:hypothetical protein